MKRVFGLLVFSLCFAAAPALAAPGVWHDVPAASHLTWIAKWMGTPVHGGFRQFRVSARIDPQHPAGGQVQVTVDTRSVYASSPTITQAIHGAEWFDSKAQPTARFQGKIERTAKGLILAGTLSLKGHSRAISFPLDLRRRGPDLVLQGQLTLVRSDFGIGTGQWRSGSMIALDVQVRFSVTLAPSAGRLA